MLTSIVVSSLLFIVLLAVFSPLMHPLSVESAGAGDSSVNERGGVKDSQRIVYVAVVIHMNQLLEDLHKTIVYGRRAYDVFQAESRIPLEVPGAKLVVDITGPTITSMLATAPDILENLKRGVELGKVEILGVTYGQIPVQYLPFSHVEKHVYYEEKLIRKVFNVKPRGLWQEDRQWTPQLPYIISRLGYEYTLIDDNVYHRANPGIDEYSVYYPHIAEYNGSRIIVFQISRFMRYHFRNPGAVDDIVKYLEDILNHTRNYPIPPIIVYGDDAEFGLSKQVFIKLSEKPWIKFTTLSEYIDKYHEYFTPANYNTTGAYPEYESMFGKNWYKWYNTPTAKQLLREYTTTSKIIREAEKTGQKWLVDAAWTSLLLAEWQYGPFYKVSGDSNLEYLVDAAVYSLLAIKHNTSKSYAEEEIINHRVGVFKLGDWGLAVDYTRNTLRALVNYRYKRIIIPLKYFNTEKWWVFTPPGIPVDAGLISSEETSGGFVIRTNSGDITIKTTNNSLIIESARNIKLEARLVPGNIIEYMYNGFPKYYYKIKNGELVLSDGNNTLTLTGITREPGRIIDERFSIYIPSLETSSLTVMITREKPGNLTVAETSSLTENTRGGGMRGLVIIVIILVLAAAGILVALLHYPRK